MVKLRIDQHYILTNTDLRIKVKQSGEYIYKGTVPGNNCVHHIFVNVPGGWKLTFTDASIKDVRIEQVRIAIRRKSA